MRLVSVSLVIAYIFAPSTAFADQVARLVYARGVGAELCPNEDALHNAVATRLGYDPFRPVAALTVMARVSRSEDTYAGEMRLLNEQGDEVGTRAINLGTSRCEDVIAALALTISIAIDPLVLSRPPPSAPQTPTHIEPPAATEAPAARAEPAPAPPRPVATAPLAPRQKPRAIHAFVGASLVGGLGNAPAPSFGGSLFGGGESGPFSLAVEARADVPASGTSLGVDVSSFVVLGGLVPCLHVSFFVACANVSAGLLSAYASGIADPRTSRAAYVVVGPRIGVEIPIGAHFRTHATLDLGVPLTRYPFAVDAAQVYQPPPVSGALGLGVSYR